MCTEAKAFQRYINFFQLLGSEDLPEDPKAAFRCGGYKPNKMQLAWINEFFMKDNLPILVTLKLPEWRDRHITTENYYQSLEEYRTIIKEIEIEFLGGNLNQWKKRPLPFIGSFQKTESRTWVFYLLIKADTLSEAFVYQICLSIQKVIDSHHFEEEVIDIEPVTNQRGISLFVIKDQKYNEDLTHDEGNTVFTLENLFKVKENPKQLSNYIRHLDQNWSYTVRVGLGAFLKFNVPNDI